MFSKFIKILGGDPNKREIEQLSETVQQINALEPAFEQLSDEALAAKTDEFRARLSDTLAGIEDEKERQQAEQAALNELLPEAFATVREAAKRTIGQRHYDVQLLGGMVLHHGRIAEMRTGEGKTLVATLPVYLNALTGRGVHLITVNDYLARYQARWMAKIYNFLGLSVGLLQMAASTENGKKAYVVDLSKESPREDQHQIRLEERAAAYAADITYGTNAEFGFDYLRDNMVYRYEDKVQRGHYFAIVDEVDNVLIDEARTPLIISGPAQGDLEWYGKMTQLMRQLKPEDYEIEEKDRTVSLTEVGIAHMEQLLGQPLRDIDRPEDITSEQARLLGYLEQAMRAQFLFRRNKDYLVQGGKVVIVDEFTGRQMPGRRWSDGLHQAIEAKEGVKVEPENITYATITIQNYFRMYQKLAGMTGTALTEAEEFDKIYKLPVLPIPTHLEYQASRLDSTLVEITAKDAAGYPIAYFSRRDDAQKTPAFWRRTDYPDVIYRTAEAKLRAIVTDILRNHVAGRPLLVGTTSVENSERLASRLQAEAVRRLLQVRLLRDAWFTVNKKEEDGRQYKELESLYQPIEQLEPAALRTFAKPLGLTSINPEDPANLTRLLELLRIEESNAARLKAVLQGGIPRQVLNARKHTEESQVIAGAGAFGAVTIATNMAGRGVDIKLGGELAEEIISAVNRILRKNGYNDPYDMRPQEQREALLKMTSADFGLYDAEAQHFLQYFDDMETVRTLGGLHVIGSERHEARRIDNQLRGRAARQGDPGSSRFYLSLEDDLMRMFGGEQVNNLMQRFQLDDDFPLEARLVGNIIEGSQHRVEGSNFDMRKHLLEYDDVLNAQRARIYSQRDRVFLKENLAEDVLELLRTEIAARVPIAMKDEEGPWKLMAWLDQTQPTFYAANGELYPSYSMRLLLNEIDLANLNASLLTIVRRAVEAEQEHIINAIEHSFTSAESALETQLQERADLLSTALEGFRDSEEKKRPQEMLEELTSLVSVPLRLTSEQLRTLTTDPQSLEDELYQQAATQLTGIAINRLLGGIELRLNEPFPARSSLDTSDWTAALSQLRAGVEEMLQNRHERLTGETSPMSREIETLLTRSEASGRDESTRMRILGSLPIARRAFYDKNHRQVTQDFTRFTYTFLAAQLAKENTSEGDIFTHLAKGLKSLEEAWGSVEFIRLGQNAVKLADFNLPAESLRALSPDTALSSLSAEQKSTLRATLGAHTINGFFRSVLLRVISELWVEYLTNVEALRVSIGLEAYAQRDPLVQYKGKASEMFQGLLAEIRAGAVSNLFVYRPRVATQVSEAPNAPAGTAETQAVSPAVSSDLPESDGYAGRKRHKKR